MQSSRALNCSFCIYSHIIAQTCDLEYTQHISVIMLERENCTAWLHGRTGHYSAKRGHKSGKSKNLLP